MFEAGRPWAPIGAPRALVACCILAIAVALLGAASAHAQAPVKVLVFHGPPDPATDAGVAAIEALSTANDFDVDATADVGALTTSNLGGYRAVVFLNSTGDRLNAAQEVAFQGYIENGGGFVGIGTSANAEPGSGSSTASSGRARVPGVRPHRGRRRWRWATASTRPRGTCR